MLAKPKDKDFIYDDAAFICHLQSFKPKPEPTEFCYRKIKDIDLSSFKKDIIECDIVQNPTEDLGGLVKQYNDKADHFNFIIKENDQRQLFKVVKGLCRSFKESPLPKHDSKEELAENLGQLLVEK